MENWKKFLKEDLGIAPEILDKVGDILRQPMYKSFEDIKNDAWGVGGEVDGFFETDLMDDIAEMIDLFDPKNPLSQLVQGIALKVDKARKEH
jgi:hypothetical protein